MSRIAFILCLLVCLGPLTKVQAQKKPATVSSLCTRDYAIDTAKQQILGSRTFDNVVQRITILLRAADLLWPHEQDKALAAFTEAFDLAVQHFKEHGDQTRRASERRRSAIISLPDQRFKVIAALAKRDPAQARKWSEQMLQENVQEIPVADHQSRTRTAEKLLQLANELVTTDVTAAATFARQSFRYPASMFLTWFLYELSKANKQVADRLYTDALAAYAKSSMDQFLYLSAYPFGNTRDAEVDNKPKASFDLQVEAAERLSDVGRRDQMLVSGVIGPSSKEESVAKVLGVIDKISEDGVRAPLLNWFYYFRAQTQISEKNLSEAREFAGKVTELDQRAYLFTRIAEESLKVAEDQTEAREVLNEIAESVSKAPKTIVSARALLALAHLYAKFDVNRGIEELGNAVKTINTLESPDFSQQFVMMKIEGKTFGSYASFSTPGFNPENAFREMGKLDFDGSLVQATIFTDKSLRALTTLAVIEPCFAKTKK